MDAMICPHCRQRADRPVFFPRAQQQIFDFIWNNPRCTRQDIENALYGPNCTNLVFVQVSKIRAALAHTSFRLVSNHHKPTKYKIEVLDANQ